MITCLNLHGEISVNSYIVSNYGTNHIFIIDPGANFPYISSLVKKNNYVLDKILITHGHFDHIGAVNKLVEKYKCSVYCHENGETYLTNPYYNLSEYCQEKIIINNVKKLNNGETITLDGDIPLSLKVIYTPGHTTDSLIFYNQAENWAVTGDAVFKDSIGAYHYPGGNLKTLIQSIKTQILSLPFNTILYTGHDAPTTVEEVNNYVNTYF